MLGGDQVDDIMLRGTSGVGGGTGQHFLREAAFRRKVPGRVARHRDRFAATTLWVLWAWLGLVAPVHAEPLRAALRLSEAADNALLTRVRGQTGDLDVAIEGVQQPALEPSFAAQLDTARALAAEHGARVVLWAARDEHGLRLVVVDFALDRVLVRSLARGEGALDRSAQEEAAALVTRSALRASLAGTALGAPAEEVLAEPTPPPVPPVVPVPVPAPIKPPPRDPTLDPEAELGVLSGIDGASKRAHHAVTLRASLGWRRLEVAALGGVGLPVTVDAPLADLTLALHRVEASAGARLLARAGWSLSSSLGAGVLIARLRAEARDPNLQATDARSATPVLTAFLRVSYRRGPLGIALRIGLDVLPNAPELGYTETNFVRARRLWTVQPQLGLGLLAF